VPVVNVVEVVSSQNHVLPITWPNDTKWLSCVYLLKNFKEVLQAISHK
jgi:hypothetical protein